MKAIKDFREQKEWRYKIKLLPDYKKIIEYSLKEYGNDFIKFEKYCRLDDCLLDAFKWDKTPEGVEYWQKIVDSIQVMPLKKCCNTWMRTSDFQQTYRCIKCKKITK